MFSSSYSVSGYLDSCSSFLTSLGSSPTTSPSFFFLFFLFHYTAFSCELNVKTCCWWILKLQIFLFNAARATKMGGCSSGNRAACPAITGFMFQSWPPPWATLIFIEYHCRRQCPEDVLSAGKSVPKSVVHKNHCHCSLRHFIGFFDPTGQRVLIRKPLSIVKG